MNGPPRALALLAAGLLAALAAAPAAHGQDRLKLKSGTVLVGEATGYDFEARSVTFVTEDGRTRQVAADDLDAASAYKLAKSRATKGDAGDELKLGDIARDIGLYAHANRHYGNALQLDPDLGDTIEGRRVVLRREAAQYCMAMAQEALRKGDAKEAEKWLTTLVEKLPDEPQAAEAEGMLAELYPKNHEGLDDALEVSHEELITGELGTGKRHYDAMLAGIQKGLTNTRSTRVARSAFEGAWTDGERALRELDKVQKELGRDGVSVGELFDGYRKLVREHMVASQLHLASTYTVQTDYKSAQRAVSKALSIDPENRQALAARARIEEAASRGWGWR